MLQRGAYLLQVYGLTVLLFLVAKVVFMWAASGDETVTVGDMWDVLVHGMTLDLSTALYCLIVPFLTCVTSVWVSVPRWVLRIYYAVLAVAFSLAFVADTSLYPFWQFKLDASCLQYLETPGDAMASVSAGYLLVRLLLLVLLVCVIYQLYAWLRYRFQPVRRRWLASLYALLLTPLMVIGIRGGIDESTTNVGQVYFSQRQFLNHAAVNPVFNFMASFEKTAHHIVDYDFYSEDECDRLMDGLYPATPDVTDTLLSVRRPDIVVILMESAGEIFADAMPRLQQLKREGVNFSNCYANTWRTDRGTVCTYSGYPSFPTSSVMKMPKKTQCLPGIAADLRAEGYETHYFYGGDINFTNMRSYLIATGFEALTWKKDFSVQEQGTSQWGVRDDIMFDAVYDYLMRPHRKPQFIGFSTLSSHQPWDVPMHVLPDTVKNAFYYLDHCIGHLVDRLRKTPQWEHTLLVILPDHSTYHFGHEETHPDRNRIPLVWVGGAVRRPLRVETICNQTDLVATLLAQLGLPHDGYVWSRNVLSRAYRYPFAVHNFNNGFTVVDSTGFMAFDLTNDGVMRTLSSDTERLERVGKAILQATTKDLKQLDAHE